MSSSGFDGLGAQSVSLEEELEDIAQKQSEVVDLEEKERELDQLRRRVNELGNEIRVGRADHRRRCAEAALPVLQPREPCAAPWEQMKRVGPREGPGEGPAEGPRGGTNQG